MLKRVKTRWWALVLGVVATAGLAVSLAVLAGGEGELIVTPYSDVIRFEAPGAASLQVQIYDLSGNLLWDSGVVSGGVVDWDRTDEYGERLAYGTYLYLVQGWSTQGDLVLQKRGKLALLPGDRVQFQAALPVSSPPGESLTVGTGPAPGAVSPLWDVYDDFTIRGRLGVGTENLSYARISLADGVVPEASAVGIPWGPTMAVYGDGKAYFVGRDVTNNIEYAMGVSIYGGAFIGAMTAHDLWFRTNNQNRLTIKANTGNIGIHTTNPAEELHVHGDFPQIILTNTCTSDWFTMGTGCAGWSLDDNLGNEPFFVSYGAPDASLVIDSDGTVGIGTWSPLAGLHIKWEYGGWELRLTDTGTTETDRSVMLFEDPDGPDWALGLNNYYDVFFLWYNPGGADSQDILRAWYDDVNDEGWVEIYDKLFVNSYCNFWDVDIYDDLNVYGTKNFVEPHPLDPDLVIVYAALEGPEAATYIRGTAELVNGEAVILLPEHFAYVTEEEGLTVQLTPIGEWLQLYVVEKSTSRIVVREATGKSGKFDYFVQGIRKGYADFQVIQAAREAAPMRDVTRIAREETVGGAPPGTPIPKSPPKEGEPRKNMPE